MLRLSYSNSHYKNQHFWAWLKMPGTVSPTAEIGYVKRAHCFGSSRLTSADWDWNWMIFNHSMNLWFYDYSLKPHNTWDGLAVHRSSKEKEQNNRFAFHAEVQKTWFQKQRQSSHSKTPECLKYFRSGKKKRKTLWQCCHSPLSPCTVLLPYATPASPWLLCCC